MPWSYTATNEYAYLPRVALHPADMARYYLWKEEISRLKHKDPPHSRIWLNGDIDPGAGFPYPAPERPFRYWAWTRKDALPNFLSAWIGKIIPQSVVDLIERHEPGVHRYLPVLIACEDGLVEDRFLLNVCNRLLTIDLDLLARDGVEYPETLPILGDFIKKSGEDVLRLRRSAVEGHALWREYRFSTAYQNFMSDELHDDLLSLGHEGIEFEKYFKLS